MKITSTICQLYQFYDNDEKFVNIKVLYISIQIKVFYNGLRDNLAYQYSDFRDQIIQKYALLSLYIFVWVIYKLGKYTSGVGNIRPVFCGV